MKRLLHFLLLAVIFFSNCQSSEQVHQIEQLEKEFETIKNKLKETEQKLHQYENYIEKPLIHIVFFKLKEEANEQQLIVEIKKLKAIKEVHHLEVGTFKALGDERAMSEFGVAMQMAFESEADYQSYQKNAIHLALKEKTRTLMTAPPVVYDYWIK